jgi:hypothetical protein
MAPGAIISRLRGVSAWPRSATACHCGHVPRYRRHDLPLLLVEMDLQLPVVPVQCLDELVTVLGQGLCLPPVHEPLDLEDPLGERASISRTRSASRSR